MPVELNTSTVNIDSWLRRLPASLRPADCSESFAPFVNHRNTQTRLFQLPLLLRLRYSRYILLPGETSNNDGLPHRQQTKRAYKHIMLARTHGRSIHTYFLTLSFWAILTHSIHSTQRWFQTVWHLVSLSVSQ